MMRVTMMLIAVAAVVLLSSCASTTLDGVWVDPEYAGEDMDNFLIIAIAESEGNRRSYESTVAEKLSKKNVRAIPGHTVLPNGQDINEDTVGPVIDENNIDAIVVTRVLGVDQSTSYVPGSTYAVPNSYYYGFYGYYSRSYAVVHEPGYYQENTTYLLETNLYDASNAKLVWSGISKSFNPSSASQVIGELSTLVVDNLKKNGLIDN
jgi:hypothetical protein